MRILAFVPMMIIALSACSGERNCSRNVFLFARILGLKGRVTKEDVKRRWKELTVQYHPDKVAHLGPKLRHVAENEMKAINEAYEYFRDRYKI